MPEQKLLSKADVIKSVTDNKEYQQACRTITQDHHLASDLYQELIEILLKYDDGKLITIYERGGLKWFIIRILTNQFHSKSSPFFKTYLSGNFDRGKDVTRVHLPDEDTSEARLLDLLPCAMEKLHWYDRELFTQYVEVGSVRKLEQRTGINYKSINLTVRKVREILKAELCKSLKS